MKSRVIKLWKGQTFQPDQYNGLSQYTSPYNLPSHIANQCETYRVELYSALVGNVRAVMDVETIQIFRFYEHIA